MKEFHNLTISNLYKRYVDAYRWISDLVNIPAENRFQEIEDKLKKINEIVANTGTIDENELLLASLEAVKFVEVVEYLKTQDKSHLPKANIKRMFEGPTYHTLEQNDNHARDIEFEFILGAKLKDSEFNIIGYDDIRIELYKYLIRIECKRPEKEGNIKSRIENAIGQINKKLKAQNEYGIVAMSFDRINSNYNKKYLGKNIARIKEEISNEKNRILKQIRNNLKLSSEKHIIGILLCFNAFIWDKEGNNFTILEMYYTQKVDIGKRDQIIDFLYDEFKERMETK
jgi:hypothetical protein